MQCDHQQDCDNLTIETSVLRQTGRTLANKDGGDDFHLNIVTMYLPGAAYQGSCPMQAPSLAVGVGFPKPSFATCGADFYVEPPASVSRSRFLSGLQAAYLRWISVNMGNSHQELSIPE